MSTEKSLPSDFIKSIYGKPVVVKLYGGTVYKGILSCLDGFLNIVLEQAEEYVDGNYSCRYSDCFLRGNNIMYLAPNDDLHILFVWKSILIVLGFGIIIADFLLKRRDFE